MEKVKFKVVLGALSFAFFLLVGMNRAEAQSATPDYQVSSLGVANVPQGNFVNNANAQSLLANQMAILKEQLATGTPGNPVYTSVELHYIYYGEIDKALQSGSTVPVSIAQGLGIFISDVYPIDANTVSQLRQSAINLLDI